MSTFNDIDITCEQCGEEFRGTIWTAVHAKQYPELKEMLLGGELNMVMCPACSHVAYQDHFVLYQDPLAELVAYVYPPSEEPQAESLGAMMRNAFREAQDVYPARDRLSYDPVLLFGLESLVELMQEEELRAEQSQIAQVLCRENKIPFVLLRPSEARRRGLVRVLPHTGGGETTRPNILDGIKKLLKINPALDLYSRIEKQISGDAGWSL